MQQILWLIECNLVVYDPSRLHDVFMYQAIDLYGGKSILKITCNFK